jgi:hypothetical protein
MARAVQNSHGVARVGMAGLGAARQGLAQRGKAGYGVAMQGPAWQGWAWLGAARHGVVGHGKVRLGAARQGMAGPGLAWRGAAGHGKVFSPRRNTMKLVDIEIRGVTALLIHRFGEEAEVGKQTRHAVVKARDPREEATKAAYIAADGTYYFSAFAIPNAMGAAGANHKLKGTRKTLRFVVPSAVRLQVEAITILNGNGPAKNFEVDSRPVTIPATKGRIMRHRPRFNEWGARFILGIDDDQLSLENAHMLLNEAGASIGIGDFRPEKRGPFGTFRVTSFKEAKS